MQRVNGIKIYDVINTSLQKFMAQFNQINKGD